MSLTLFHPELFGFNEGGFNELLRPLAAFPKMSTELRALPMDVAEEDTAFIVSADIPGVPKEDVHVSAKNGVVTISVDSKTEKTDERKDEETGKVMYHSRERSHRFVSRSIKMPKSANLKECRASMNDGVLRLTIPKLMLDDVKDEGERIAIN